MRKLSVPDIRWEIYLAKPNPESYKGFSLKGSLNETNTVGKITFSNGEEDFHITSETLESAFIRAFDLVDKYQKDKNQ